jgi:hypothetical protein
LVKEQSAEASKPDASDELLNLFAGTISQPDMVESEKLNEADAP